MHNPNSIIQLPRFKLQQISHSCFLRTYVFAPRAGHKYIQGVSKFTVHLPCQMSSSRGAGSPLSLSLSRSTRKTPSHHLQRIRGQTSTSVSRCKRSIRKEIPLLLLSQARTSKGAQSTHPRRCPNPKGQEDSRVMYLQPLTPRPLSFPHCRTCMRDELVLFRFNSPQNPFDTPSMIAVISRHQTRSWVLTHEHLH